MSLKAKGRSSTGRGAEMFIVRMPPGMRDKIAALAGLNHRSMNSEIVAAIEKSFERDPVKDLRRRVKALEEKLRGEMP